MLWKCLEVGWVPQNACNVWVRFLMNAFRNSYRFIFPIPFKLVLLEWFFIKGSFVKKTMSRCIATDFSGLLIVTYSVCPCGQ